MANTTIYNLPALNTVDSSTVFPVSSDFTGTPTTYQASIGNIGNAITGNIRMSGDNISSINSNIVLSTGSSDNWTFNAAGNLTLPRGGSISETNIPFGSLSGNTISLTPSGGLYANQQLLIYPTIAGDYNHLHLTSGNLYDTELFLGNDDLYVKLANTGDIVLNANNGTGNTAQYTFSSNGNLSIPGNVTSTNFSGNWTSSNVEGSGNTWTSVINMDGYLNQYWYQNYSNGGLPTNTYVGYMGFDSSNDLYMESVNGNIELITNGQDYFLYGNGTASLGNLVTATNFTAGTGVVDFNTNSANVQLGNASNVHLYGGSSGQVLQTDGTGNLGWYSVSASEVINGNSNVSIPTQNGNVYVNANGGTDQQWIFDTSGVLTLADSGSYSIIQSPPGSQIDIYTGGSGSQYTEINLIDNGNFYVNTAGETYTWAFDNTGNLTTPGNILTSGSSGNITGANVIEANTFTSTGNVTILSNGNTWTFGTDGNLTIPSNVIIGSGGDFTKELIVDGSISAVFDNLYATGGNINADKNLFAGRLQLSDQPNDLPIPGVTTVDTSVSFSLGSPGDTGNIYIARTIVRNGTAGVADIIPGKSVDATIAPNTPTLVYTVSDSTIIALELRINFQYGSTSDTDTEIASLYITKNQAGTANVAVGTVSSTSGTIPHATYTANVSGGGLLQVYATTDSTSTSAYYRYRTVEFGGFFGV